MTELTNTTRDLRAIHLLCSCCSTPTPALARTIVAIDDRAIGSTDRTMRTWSTVCSSCVESIIDRLQPRADARCAMCLEPCYGRNETTWLLLLTARNAHYARLCRTHARSVVQRLVGGPKATLDLRPHVLQADDLTVRASP